MKYDKNIEGTILATDSELFTTRKLTPKLIDAARTSRYQQKMEMSNYKID